MFCFCAAQPFYNSDEFSLIQKVTLTECKDLGVANSIGFNYYINYPPNLASRHWACVGCSSRYATPVFCSRG